MAVPASTYQTKTKTMKNLVLMTGLLCSMALSAQPGNMAARNEARGSKVEWTVAELQETLSISEAEAQKVKSILDSQDARTAEMRTAKKAQMQEVRANASELSDADIEKLQLQRFADMRQKIDLEEQNYQALRQVLSPTQIQKLERAERQERRADMPEKGARYKK